LSDEKGIAKFYVSSGQPEYKQDFQNWNYGNKSSSLLPPDKHLEVFPWLQFKYEINIETTTLKKICNDYKFTTIDFIHMDVQGAELKVLKGAESLIKKVRLIWLEVEAIELYENQPLKRDIEEFMRTNRFYKVKDTVDSMYGDQLYINLDYSFRNVSFLSFLLISLLKESTKSSLGRCSRALKKILVRNK
jgi:FkbM family methyltransferase